MSTKTKSDPHAEREYELKRKQHKLSILDMLGRALAAVLVAVIGIWQFSTQQKQAKTLEFERELFQQKTNVLEHTCKAVAGITSSAGTFVKNPKEYERYSHEFMQVYRGEVTFLGSQKIKSSCDDFFHDLMRFDRLIAHDLKNFDIANTEHEQHLSMLRQTGDSLVSLCQQYHDSLYKTVIK